MRASRGGKGSERSRRPAAVMRPSASSASSSRKLLARRVDGRGRRRIDPRQRPRIGRSPFRAVEQQRRQIGRADLGLGERQQALRLRLVPQAITDARLGAAGAAAALIGGGAGHAHRLEPRHADIGLETRHPRQTAVDDDPHTFDGDRRLGDRRREHHLAHARRRRLEREVLRLHIHRAVERRHHDARIADALPQPLLDAAYLALPRQEREDGAALLAQRPHHRGGHLVLDARRGVAAEIARVDRKGAPFAGDDRRIAQQPRHARAVQRRRHRRECAGRRAGRAGSRAPAPARGRRRASARGTRRTAPRRRRTAPDRRGSCA